MRIKYQYLVLICFVLAGTCIGLFVGFIIAERYIPIPTMPETVAKVVSHELVRINDKVGEYLKNKDSLKINGSVMLTVNGSLA